MQGRKLTLFQGWVGKWILYNNNTNAILYYTHTIQTYGILWYRIGHDIRHYMVWHRI